MFHTFSTQVASTFNSRWSNFPWQGGIHDNVGLDFIVLSSKKIWDDKTLVGLGNSLGNFAKTFEAMKQARYISHICICVYMLLVWIFKFSQFNQGKTKLRIYFYIFQYSLSTRKRLSTIPILNLWNLNFPLDKYFVKISAYSSFVGI